VQRFVRWVLAPLARLILRPAVSGTHRIPRRGPVLLAANHRAAVDTALLAFVTPRPVAFLGKAEYFTDAGLRRRLSARFLTALGYVPVDRDHAKAGLDRGGVFAIYPEGTPSRDGRRHRGHAGVASLALSTGATVVPVALVGTQRVQPVGARMPRLAPVQVRFGRPLDFSRYEGLEGSAAIRRAVTDEVMDAIVSMSGQEYVDHYHPLPGRAA
jgi:1-acyl-sn-glycerol-3-phosphate acyltransferase